MMRKLGAALVGVSLTFLAACSSVREGTVIGKSFAPAHDDHYTTYICYSYDKNGACTLNMPMDNVSHVGDNWQLDLRNKDNDTGWVDVSESDYNSYDIGSYYPKGS